MKKTLLTGLALGIVGSVAMFQNAMAMTLSLTDGTTTATLNDTDGLITYIGPIGDWSINGTCKSFCVNGFGFSLIQ